MRRLPMRLVGWLLLFIIIGPVALNVWAGCAEEEETETAPETGVTRPSELPGMAQAVIAGDGEAPEQSSVDATETPIPSHCTRVKYGKGVFDLPWTEFAGQKFYQIEDKEVQALCVNIGCRLGHSFVGETFTAHSYGHQVIVVNGEKTMRVNGKERPLIGSLRVEGGKYYVDASLLWYVLAMQPRQQGDTVSLQQTLYEPKFVNEGQGRRLVLATAGSLRWENQELEDGTSVITVFNTAWAGEQAVYDYDDLHVELYNTKDGNVEVTLGCMDSWTLFPRKGLRTNELVIGLLPNYPRASEPVMLTGAALDAEGEEDQTLTFSATGGYWYHWFFDAGTRTLRLDFSGVNSRISGDLNKDIIGLSSCRVSSVGDRNEPVTRFSAVVKSGYKFEITASPSADGELLLRVFPGSLTENLYDEGYTQGYVFARGVIVLDPGHGGGDTGCINRSLGLKEKDITLDVALRLRELLEASGWTVIMTRETDKDVSWFRSPDTVELQARCDVANDNNAMWFISLHCNANRSSAVNGSSVYWYKHADKKLARGLNKALGANLGLRDIGLLRDGFYVLRYTSMPACLIEMAFLSNPHDARLLGQENFRQQIAQNLADAIEALAAE
ncbi:MAG: N-acetylmuramoyl-L-alanine amidase [bacterium]|nr:N-acetylmuramoyl-L-alanine amidase [bacterium]